MLVPASKVKTGTLTTKNILLISLEWNSQTESKKNDFILCRFLNERFWHVLTHSNLFRYTFCFIIAVFYTQLHSCFYKQFQSHLIRDVWSEIFVIFLRNNGYYSRNTTKSTWGHTHPLCLCAPTYITKDHMSSCPAREVSQHCRDLIVKCTAISEWDLFCCVLYLLGNSMFDEPVRWIMTWRQIRTLLWPPKDKPRTIHFSRNTSAINSHKLFSCI
jgi:hypothetical protein